MSLQSLAQVAVYPTLAWNRLSLVFISPFSILNPVVISAFQEIFGQFLFCCATFSARKFKVCHTFSNHTLDESASLSQKTVCSQGLVGYCKPQQPCSPGALKCQSQSPNRCSSNQEHMYLVKKYLLHFHPSNKGSFACLSIPVVIYLTAYQFCHIKYYLDSDFWSQYKDRKYFQLRELLCCQV